MNRIFGFFKQKIIQVKQENKQELQTIANAFNQNEYSTEKVLTLLQSIKSNYMNWNILIANQASTGLYYSQLHNRNICLRKIKSNEEQRKQMQKNKMKLSHIKDTVKQLKQISELNQKWMSSINGNIEQINCYLTYMKKKVQEEQLLLVKKVKFEQIEGSGEIQKNIQSVQEQKIKQIEIDVKQKEDASPDKQNDFQAKNIKKIEKSEKFQQIQDDQ